MRKSIKISEKNYEALNKIKGNGTYDDAIASLIGGGYFEKIPAIRREQVAFHLEELSYDAHNNLIGSEDMVVTFKDLRDSKIGDIFGPKGSNYQNYSREDVRVIYKNDHLVLVEFIETDTIIEKDECTVIAVHLL